MYTKVHDVMCKLIFQLAPIVFNTLFARKLTVFHSMWFVFIHSWKTPMVDNACNCGLHAVVVLANNLALGGRQINLARTLTRNDLVVS